MHKYTHKSLIKTKKCKYILSVADWLIPFWSQLLFSLEFVNHSPTFHFFKQGKWAGIFPEYTLRDRYNAKRMYSFLPEKNKILQKNINFSIFALQNNNSSINHYFKKDEKIFCSVFSPYYL